MTLFAEQLTILLANLHADTFHPAADGMSEALIFREIFLCCLSLLMRAY
jgi:hypothetical protein